MSQIIVSNEQLASIVSQLLTTPDKIGHLVELEPNTNFASAIAEVVCDYCDVGTPHIQDGNVIIEPVDHDGQAMSSETFWKAENGKALKRFLLQITGKDNCTVWVEVSSERALDEMDEDELFCLLDSHVNIGLEDRIDIHRLDATILNVSI